MFGGLIKVLLHRPGIGLRQDERYARIPCRTDSAKHVRAFVTLIDGLTGTRTTLRPLPHTAVLLANVIVRSGGASRGLSWRCSTCLCDRPHRPPRWSPPALYAT